MFVFFVCAWNPVVPRHHPSISWNLLCWESNFVAEVYQSLIVAGSGFWAKIFWRILVLIPSMKYSMSVLSSVSLARPARILNCVMYLSAPSLPCLRCHSWACASPSVSAAENAFLSTSIKVG